MALLRLLLLRQLRKGSCCGDQGLFEGETDSAAGVFRAKKRRFAILVQYHGLYTWEELDRAAQQVYTMLKSVPRPIDMIVVLDATAKAPTDGDLMGRFRSILKNTPILEHSSV